ncbi:hypothetical protein [uncultured Paraglaciecola sp.]|uniref:hypothetical protein n=1 Tax=uncultured Paraglaciecola sp. TaxID=1765024 RepID=UPI0030D6E74D|tara:strand:+ start:7593 stop:8429 length:837 start_codon:yes stop_codon:yes gene_type:complete
MKLVIFILSVLLVLSANAGEPITIRLAVINSKNDLRHEYSQQLQKLIIASSPADIEVDWVPFPSDQQHRVLLDNHAIDVFAMPSDEKLEQQYHAIRYPIFKGLMGYRLMLVKNENRQILEKITDIQALKQFTIGQGSQWQDTKIFSENGFVVITSRHYNRLFEMLGKNRFELFPRSILEIWREEQTFSTLGISVEPNIILHYPLAMFYFIRKNEPELRQALENGFKVAIENGSFDALFNKYHEGFIKRAKLEQRTLIEIPNSFAPNIPSDETALYITL